MQEANLSCFRLQYGSVGAHWRAPAESLAGCEYASSAYPVSWCRRQCTLARRVVLQLWCGLETPVSVRVGGGKQEAELACLPRREPWGHGLV